MPQLAWGLHDDDGSEAEAIRSDNRLSHPCEEGVELVVHEAFTEKFGWASVAQTFTTKLAAAAARHRVARRFRAPLAPRG